MSKKTLSPKLKAIRDSMVCAQCKRIGMGRRVSEVRTKPLIECKCESCEDTFLSKDPRRYCSVMCWTASPDFRAHLARISEKGRAAFKKKCADGRRICPVCQINPVKPGNKFCSVKCWRRHYAELFDYQIANPSTIEEIHGYDEYLSQEELPCLVEGCDWKGKYPLST